MTDRQPALFEADQLAPKHCPVPGCQAIQYPNANQVPTCHHDLNPPDNRPYRRPRGCLNAYDPTTADIGF